MRGRWLAVLGLALMVGSLSLLSFIKPPAATAQTAPEVTYTLTCEPNPLVGGNNVKYAATIKNPNAAGTAAIAYTLIRHWDDNRTDHTANLTVAPQETKPSNLSNNTGVTVQWNHTLTIKTGGASGTTVWTSENKTNPCVASAPPEITYDVTCQKTTAGVPETVKYTLSVKNPNGVAAAYSVVRHWDDNRADHVLQNVNVPAGGTVSGASVDYASPVGLAAQWNHTLTLKVGETTVATAPTKQNPCYTAPSEPDPPEISFELTCQKTTAGAPEKVLYAPTIKNPNTVAQSYKMVITWSDDRAGVEKTIEVDAGETVSGDATKYEDTTGLTTEWNSTLTVKVGETTVGTPVTKPNPCYTAPNTNPSDPTSTTTNPIAAASNNSGGGLASTGVGIAVAAIAGVGLLLFANGFGLMRLVRRGGDHL